MNQKPRTSRQESANSATPAVFGFPTIRRSIGMVRSAVLAIRPRSATGLTDAGLYFLAVVAVIFLFAMLGDVNLLIILAGMLLGVLWMNWWQLHRTVRGLEARRRMPRSIGAGDQLAVSVELANLRRRGGNWAIAVQDGIRRLGNGHSSPLEPTLFFPYVPARQSRTNVYRARFPQRGRYQFAPLSISTRYPFGFFRRTLVCGQEESLLVVPRLGRLMPKWLARHHESFEGSPRRERRYGRFSGEFYGVRPWRSGDSRRHIHWRSSARHGNLVVRQFDQQRNRDLALLVDLWLPEQPGPAHLENVELAVSFTATVVADTCRRSGGSLVVGTTAAIESVLRGAASPGLMQDVMERLAVAEAHSEDRLEGLLGGALEIIEPGAEVILVTTRPLELSGIRFSRLDRHPAWRSVMSRMRVINTAEPELGQYFQPGLQ